MNKEIERVIEFTDFKSFWEKYKPLTPYGRDNKRRMHFFLDTENLLKEQQYLAEFISYIQKKSVDADRAEYHLKKIPEMEPLNTDNFDTTTLFLIKKFLLNFKQTIKLLDKSLIPSLDLKFELNELVEFLSLGQGNKETFHLSALYDERLEKLRATISDFEKKLNVLRKEQLALIKDKLNLDFRFNSFLVLEEKTAVELDKELLFLEPYDSKHLIAKPIMPKDYYSLKKEMDSYLEEELKIQKEVMNSIGEKIIKKRNLLEDYIKQVEKLDIYLTKARLALKYKMIKPELTSASEQTITIKDGCFLPLVEKTEQLNTTYSPLNVEFDTRVNVINGSNMGGKTILLKTIGFLQLLTQLGFYVPAQSFKTTVFKKIFYIGNLDNNPVEGLSSFGLEINALVECFKEESGDNVKTQDLASLQNTNTLYLLDEFARTTNSLEAKALLQAVLQEFSQRTNSTSFVSTHFVELNRQDAIGYYHMKGLDYEEYLKYYKKDLNYSLHERIVLINRFMRYEVEKTEEMVHSYDALKIADTLGLDKSITDNAKKYLENK